MANSSANILNYIGKRAFLLINIFLILAQLATLVGLYTLGESYQLLRTSAEMAPLAHPHAMSNGVTGYLSSRIVIALLGVVFLGNVYKQFRLGSKKTRLVYSLSILAFFVVIFGLASHSMYTPILNS